MLSISCSRRKICELASFASALLVFCLPLLPEFYSFVHSIWTVLRGHSTTGWLLTNTSTSNSPELRHVGLRQKQGREPRGKNIGDSLWNHSPSDKVHDQIEAPENAYVHELQEASQLFVTTINPPWPGKSYKLACSAGTTADNCAKLGSAHGLRNGCAEPERGTQEVLNSLLLDCNGCLYIDVGCNIGYFAAHAAALGAKVECYEPTPNYVDAIKMTGRLNGILNDHWSIHNVAVVPNSTGSASSLEFTDAHRPCGMETGSGNGKSWRVLATSIRSILFGKKVKLLKVGSDSIGGAIFHTVSSMITRNEAHVDSILVSAGNNSSPMEWSCSGTLCVSPSKQSPQVDAQDFLKLQRSSGYDVYRTNIHVGREIYDWAGRNVNSRMVPQRNGVLPMFAIRSMRKLEKVFPSASLSNYQALFHWGASFLVTKVQLAELSSHHPMDLQLAGTSLGKLNHHNPAMELGRVHTLEEVLETSVVTIIPPWPGKPYKLACSKGTTADNCAKLGSVHGLRRGCAEPERDTQEVLNSFLLDCKMCLYIDVGCNIGYFAAHAAALGAKVECYEPTPNYVDAIKITGRLNDVPVDNWIIRNAAVVPASMDDRPVVNEVYRPCGISAGSSNGGKSWGELAIPIRTILLGKKVKLLKIDIDSYEGAIFHTVAAMIMRNETMVESILIEAGDHNSPMEWSCRETICVPPSKHSREGDVEDFLKLQRFYGYDVYRANVHVGREIYDWAGSNVNEIMVPQRRGVLPMSAVRNMRKLEKILPSASLHDYLNLFHYGTSFLVTREELATLTSHDTVDLDFARSSLVELNKGNPLMDV